MIAFYNNKMNKGTVMRTFIKTTQMLALSLAAGLGFGFSTQTQAAASAIQVTEKAKSDYAKPNIPF